MLLKDKVAIVTGGNSGIGEAIVLALMEALQFQRDASHIENINTHMLANPVAIGCVLLRGEF